MTERPMTKVVTKTCYRDIEHLSISHAQIRLFSLNNQHLFPGQVTGANTVLKTFVTGVREHLVTEAQLLQVLQALKLRRINNVPKDLLQRDLAMNRVLQ